MTRYPRSQGAIFCYFLLALLCSLPQAMAASRVVATVATAQGTVSVQRSAARLVALTAHSSLYEGDIVRTGARSKASILFADGSFVKLNANAAIRIATRVSIKGNRSLFEALSGEIWARLRPGRAANTKYSNLVVRGTEITLTIADDGTTTLAVLEGTVDFFNELGAVVVNTRQQSTVYPGAAPTPPVTIDNAGFIVEWTLDLDQAALSREKFFRYLDPRAALSALAQRKPAGPNPTAANLRAYGDTFFDAGRFQPAIDQYEAALRLEPRDWVTQVHRGDALLEMDRLDEAEAAYRLALSLSPANTVQAEVRPAAATMADGETTDAESVVSPLCGLAWVALKRNRPGEARRFAEQAVAAAGTSAEARIVSGLAFLRSGEIGAAIPEFEQATKAFPVALRYQGYTYRGLAALLQNDIDTATRAARQAVEAAPASALAHANLATIYFVRGQATEAAHEAQQATRLDPDSATAQQTLAQTQLAQGDVDAAAASAARAVALDPVAVQAYYLLGLADAGRRDYSHAVRELKRGLEIAPGFIPAAVALARVYVRMGRATEAQVLMTGLEEEHGTNDMVLAAFGEVLYEQGRYEEALRKYEQAVRANPGSALTCAGWARLALDANQLNVAIRAGQRAVALAPQIAQYHSILGLAYNYARLDAQAEREFRTALALDPQNALALVQLGFKNREGDPRTQQRTSGLTFVQGFIYDPAVSRDLLRGGVHTQVGGSGGAETLGVDLAHRTVANEGRLNFYGRYVRDKDDGDRPNSDLTLSALRQDTTYVLGPRTNLYFHLQQSRNWGGLPGPLQTPITDDERDFHLNEGILAARQRVGKRGYLWAGVFSSAQRDLRFNPNKDGSLAYPVTGDLVSTFNVSTQNDRSRAFAPELRLDINVGNAGQGKGVLTLGMARLRTNADTAAALVIPAFAIFPEVRGNLVQQKNYVTSFSYVQLAQRLTPRLMVTGQLRSAKVERTLSRSGKMDNGFFNFTSPPITSSRRYTLPSLTASYQANRKTAFRLLASRRITDVTSSIFAPVSTVLTTEAATLPVGLPDPVQGGNIEAFELDIERQLAPGHFLKAFLFHSTGRSLLYDFSGFANVSDIPRQGNPVYNILPIDRVRRSGLGLRYEQQLGRSLFSQATLSYSRSTNRTSLSYYDFQNTGALITVPAIYSSGQTPYDPRLLANWSLNYISRRGTKFGLDLRYTGPIYADTGDPSATTRPHLSSKVLVNLLLARERSVHHEYFVLVNNLFDTRQYIFNDIPLSQRRIIVGVNFRF